jgi:hypothetical protein
MILIGGKKTGITSDPLVLPYFREPISHRTRSKTVIAQILKENGKITNTSTKHIPIKQTEEASYVDIEK